MEEDELYKDSPLKGLLAQMARSSKGEKKVLLLGVFLGWTFWKQFILTAFSHAHFQGKWVNSPNVYQKVEVLETGTSDPKKITKVTQIAFDSPGKQKKK